MDAKARFTLIASSLGSYFGVGFNNPSEQLQMDMGIIPVEFDEEAEERMLLGKELEDGVLNFFEKKLGITINERNTEIKEGMNGMIRYRMDGKTILGGEETVVECKVSNSQSTVFINELGYIIQCNLYMAEEGVDQALLCGLYQGKPIYKILRRNDELVADIREMIANVYGILNGILDYSEFPWHLVEKYSKTPALETLSELDENDLAYLESYTVLKEAVKENEKQIALISEYLKSKYNNVLYTNKEMGMKFTITEQTRKGFLDEIALSMEHPELNLDAYRKPASESKVIRITRKG